VVPDGAAPAVLLALLAALGIGVPVVARAINILT